MPTSAHPSRAAFVTAAAAGCIILLAGTAALAVAAHPALVTPTVERGVPKALALMQGLVPPPGAAMLLIAGLLAARRGHR